MRKYILIVAVAIITIFGATAYFATRPTTKASAMPIPEKAAPAGAHQPSAGFLEQWAELGDLQTANDKIQAKINKSSDGVKFHEGALAIKGLGTIMFGEQAAEICGTLAADKCNPSDYSWSPETLTFNLLPGKTGAPPTLAPAVPAPPAKK